jgi:hypothetical protein
MISLNNVFSDDVLQKYIREKNIDLWVGTKYEGYTFLSPKQKGEYGELFVQKYMQSKGSIVLPKKNSGHDRIIDNYKTEIKFSLCNKNKNLLREDYFFINHVSIGKDWDRLIFVGVNYNEDKSRIIWFSKKDFIADIINLFDKQQGGKNMNNDDFKLSGNIHDLLTHPFVKTIEVWNA